MAEAWAGVSASLPLLPPSGPRRRWAAATAAASSAPRAERVGSGGNGAQRHRSSQKQGRGRGGRRGGREDTKTVSECGVRPQAHQHSGPASVSSAGVERGREPRGGAPSLREQPLAAQISLRGSSRDQSISAPHCRPAHPTLTNPHSPHPGAPLPPFPLAESAGPLGPARHSQGPQHPPPPPPTSCLLCVIRVPCPRTAGSVRRAPAQPPEHYLLSSSSTPLLDLLFPSTQ